LSVLGLVFTGIYVPFIWKGQYQQKALPGKGPAGNPFIIIGIALLFGIQKGPPLPPKKH